jgi:hypothetical protein
MNERNGQQISASEALALIENDPEVENLLRADQALYDFAVQMFTMQTKAYLAATSDSIDGKE